MRRRSAVITTRLHEETLDYVKALAAERGVGLATVVREIVEESRQGS